MKTTVKNLSDTKVELTITLDAEALADAQKVATIKLSKTVKVPGFRAGKVPASVAAKHLDPQKLQEQLLDDAISKAVAETLAAAPAAAPTAALAPAQNTAADVQALIDEHLQPVITAARIATARIDSLESRLDALEPRFNDRIEKAAAAAAARILREEISRLLEE